MVAKYAALFLMASFIVFGFLAGFSMSALAFRDPDICWLLALGRWISEHGYLPYRDPFSSNLYSYALVSPNLPLMQYQWLAELLFFSFWRLGKEPALLLFLSALAAFTFVAIPVWILLNRRFSVLALIVVGSGLVAVFVRFVARPEMLSSFWLALLIAVLYRYRQYTVRQQFLASVAVFFIAAFWSNSHMLFPLAGLASGSLSLAWCVQEHRESGCKAGQGYPLALFFLCLPFLAVLAGTLLNPWGVGLWQYEARLLVSPVSFANIDHQAPVWADMHGLAALIFFAAGLISIGLVVGDKGWLACLPGVLLYGLSLVLGIKYAKLIPQSYLLVCAALACLPGAPEETGKCGRLPYLRALSSAVGDVWSRQKKLVLISLVGVSCLGALALMQMQGITSLPAATQCFTPPLQAIAYLDKVRLPGRLLNEGLLGSTMIWHMRNCPDLFMDSRFSMFEPALVRDYESMLLCEGNWQQLLKKYDIAWVFLPAGVPLARVLLTDSSWQLNYKDQLAVVLSRKALAGSNVDSLSGGVSSKQQSMPDQSAMPACK